MGWGNKFFGKNEEKVRKIGFFVLSGESLREGKEGFLLLEAGKYQSNICHDFSWVFLGFGGFFRNTGVLAQQRKPH